MPSALSLRVQDRLEESSASKTGSKRTRRDEKIRKGANSHASEAKGGAQVRAGVPPMRYVVW